MKTAVKFRKISINSLKFPKISFFPHETVKKFVKFFNPDYKFEEPIQYSYPEWTRRSLLWVLNRYLTGLIPNLAAYHFFGMKFTIFSVFIFGATIYWGLEFLKQIPKLIEIKQEVKR